MGIKTVSQPPYRSDLSPSDFWLFPKLRGCRYETIEELKEAVTKVTDTLTQEDFHGIFQKLLESYKYIEAGGDYLKGTRVSCVPSLQAYCMHLVFATQIIAIIEFPLYLYLGDCS